MLDISPHFSLPRLYKKTSLGALQFWEIRVFSRELSTDKTIVGEIVTVYGQEGTDSPQVTTDIISVGKNAGRVNETSALEQAVKEAKSSWLKKKKGGYVEGKEAAGAGEVDSVITGGMSPMLAHKFSEQGHKIVYPCFAQPKLDGIRCVAIVKDGVCTLWTRTRKPILSCPHIVSEIESFGHKNLILDGELYSHAQKNDFEGIVSAVRKESPSALSEKIQYHVYDMAGDGRQEALEIPFSNRTVLLKNWLSEKTGKGIVVLVETRIMRSEDDVLAYFEEKRSEGYEGIMLRNAKAPYVNKRSYDLQKMKEFDDADFQIVGIEEGRGKLSGHVAAFICSMAGENEPGKTFSVSLNAPQDFLRKCFLDKTLWEGKTLVVQYQGLTKLGKPRFPKGVRFRDSEDF